MFDQFGEKSIKTPPNHKSLDVPTMAFCCNRNPLDLPLSFYLVSTFKREQKGRRSMIAQQKETGCDEESEYSRAIRIKIEILTKDIFLIQKKRLSLRSIWAKLSLKMKL
jgi:hypothetical protein